MINAVTTVERELSGQRPIVPPSKHPGHLQQSEFEIQLCISQEH
jgi:hypothetical protein